MQIAKAIRLLLLPLLLYYGFNSFAAITVDSVKTQNSNCANDGVISIYAHSGSAMVYAIKGGPELRPPQSGSQFAALPSGTYLVLVTNFANDTAFVNATVGGTYTFPDFTPIYQHPRCASTATGMIIGNAQMLGRLPYTWHLTNTGTGVTTVQSTDTFYNLPAGTYSIRQYDSCLNFATRSITLIDPVHNLAFGNINNRLISCDSVEIYIQLYIDGGQFAFPYTLQVQTPNGTFQYPIPDWTYYNGYWPDFTQRVGNVSYGDYCHLTITDGCGQTIYHANKLSPFNINASFGGATDSCQPRYVAYFNVQSPIQDPDVMITEMTAPVTVTLSNPVTNAIIATNVNTDTTDNSVFLAFSAYAAPGQQYRVTLTDGCGNTYTNIYQWPTVNPASLQQFVTQSYCLDSTIGYSFNWYNQFYSIPTFELLTGPASIQSSKPHYTYRDTIIYPQVYQALAGGNNGTGDFTHYIGLSNLGVGMYTYRITDSCGTSLTGSFTITPSMVSDLHYSYSYERGCPGQNKLYISHNNPNAYNVYSIIEGGANNFPPIYREDDSLINLDADTYAITMIYYDFTPYDVAVNSGGFCNTVHDTIVIPPYDLPKIDYAVQIKCNGTVNVGLIPDSTKGLAPYSYEIIGGPQTVSAQTSNYFTFTIPGNYTARISDVCGFARTFTFSVDTLAFADIVRIGSSCQGGTVKLIAQHSPYATYVWHQPNGSNYTGDTLTLSPVTPANYGNYDIMKIVSVNNCRDTFYLTYTLTSSNTNYIYTTICTGDSATLNGTAYKQTGVYYDTIATPACDSIIALHLTVQVVTTDTLVVSICTGQSITVGTHTYNNTGTYHDTLSTSNGCDSIVVLYLTADSYKRDSIAQAICTGQSITVGAHTYSTTGVYRDTLSTSTCDSIHVLDLTVNDYKRDSVISVICAGRSVTVGMHTYNSTGIYRDTLSTLTCDSIHVLNLTVQEYKRDTLNTILCYGEPIIIGSHTYTTTGTYRDTIGTTTCDSIVLLNLVVNAQVITTRNATICEGQTVISGNTSYGTAGVYSDTLTSLTGCDSIVILTLTVNNAKRDTLLADICEGDSLLINGIVYRQPGVYTDTFNTTGCDSIRTLILSVYPKPVFSLNQTDTAVMAGTMLQITTSSTVTYQFNWYTTDGIELNTYTTPSVTATANNTGWVIAKAYSGNNCSAADSLFITVTHCNESIYVPNAFTPNSDGNNDQFKIYGQCIKVQQIQVFNRWGEKVWETQDAEQGWNGYYKGQLQMPGVYVYLVQYFATDQPNNLASLLKGSVTLIR